MKTFLLSTTLVFTSFMGALSQEKELDFYAETDVYSRFVWRGADYGNSPSIQPSMGITYKNFDFMVWGGICHQ